MEWDEIRLFPVTKIECSYVYTEKKKWIIPKYVFFHINPQPMVY